MHLKVLSKIGLHIQIYSYFLSLQYSEPWESFRNLGQPCIAPVASLKISESSRSEDIDPPPNALLRESQPANLD